MGNINHLKAFAISLFEDKGERKGCLTLRESFVLLKYLLSMSNPKLLLLHTIAIAMGTLKDTYKKFNTSSYNKCRKNKSQTLSTFIVHESAFCIT